MCPEKRKIDEQSEDEKIQWPKIIKLLLEKGWKSVALDKSTDIGVTVPDQFLFGQYLNLKITDDFLAP